MKGRLWGRGLAAAVLIAAQAMAVAMAADAVRDERCGRLETRVAELRLKLRMGYGAQEGRMLRQRLARLEAERRRACRR
jgi:hypothetical protein